LWDKKHRFCKNEPEKLLKKKDWQFKMGQNEPENEPEKSFRFSTCGKTNRDGVKNKLADLPEYEGAEVFVSA
jgi:hypothetical protein